MSNLVADKVMDTITIPDVLRRYGYVEKRGRRIPCPIHNGKDANFCYTDKVFHCWTCGAKGNVIGFVMQVFNINYAQAVLKLNADFSLGLTAKKPTMRERREQADNRRIQEAFYNWKREKQKVYLRLTSAHAALFRQLQLDPKNNPLKEYVTRLEKWLDENIEEVRL
ncbi:MAG: CHC2 zinc finger domain-containing protein [Aminipila sp.]